MFSKILIANRGEIACRIATTARRIGVATVGVYSDADADARHLQLCDEALRIGAAPARESYLRAEAIIQTALRSGAQAIHPGYGFLSENEAFAQACADAGLVFIGPPPGAIAAMGSKSAAKALMHKAGVPLVPGYHGDDQDPARLAAAADAIGYPVLIKASAGGGGKGMRIVTTADEFAAALASCRREAKASFNDDQVLVERYLQQPRHIEIQVFADQHGDCVYLFERDCSVQRRHQKVLEEAPAPGMTDARRQAMGQAAVDAARAVGYVGAGTVEFIVDRGGEFYFMEMNTRLQVEHPVTEMISGFDLVEWQLRVAAGERLPAKQADLRIDGHAIEARVYAENPDTGFLPSIGRLRHLRFPAAAQFTVRDAAGAKAAVRVDSGVRSGDEISPHYDPMIAKLIVWGADRRQALARMREALAQTEVVGVQTNVAFLARVVAGAAFAGAELDTGLIERNRASLLPPPQAPGSEPLAAAAAAVIAREQSAPAAQCADPWALTDGWRLNGSSTRRFRFQCGEHQLGITLEHARAGWLARPQNTDEAPVCLAALQLNGDRLTGLIGDRRLDATVIFDGDSIHLFERGRHDVLRDISRQLVRADADVAHGSMTAPMPGKVIALNVKAGDAVSKGQVLLVMEAMKMEHSILASADGKIRELRCALGDQVLEGAQLVVFE